MWNLSDGKPSSSRGTIKVPLFQKQLKSVGFRERTVMDDSSRFAPLSRYCVCLYEISFSLSRTDAFQLEFLNSDYLRVSIWACDFLMLSVPCLKGFSCDRISLVRVSSCDRFSLVKGSLSDRFLMWLVPYLIGSLLDGFFIWETFRKKRKRRFLISQILRYLEFRFLWRPTAASRAENFRNEVGQGLLWF